MIGYDFDKTIYDGDSSTDFFVFMLLHRPYLLLFAPYFLVVLALYAIKIVSKKKVKELLFFYIPWHKKSLSKLVNKFWEKHANKIFDWYSFQKKEDDIIISASLTFLLEPIMNMLSIKNWISTKYIVETGKIDGENCYGNEKLVQFKKKLKNQELEAFYSDSLSDLPMMKYARTAYLVKNKIPQKLEEE